MRKSFLFSVFFVFLNLLLFLKSNAQDTTKFVLTNQGVAPIIIKINGQKPENIYKKAKSWILKKYPNVKEKLKQDIINKTLLIEGYREKAWFYMLYGMKQEFDLEYSLKIDIQADGNVELTFTLIQFWVTKNEKAIFDYNLFFPPMSKGKISWEFADAKASLENTMNSIGSSLLTQITSKKNKQREN